MVNRRGIYKDVYGSSNIYQDYQLRPNLCVAMAVAPSLFDKKHAKICLDNVSKILMTPGCMGIKTLDPSDMQFNGNYHGSDPTNGFNYHQGPEWLWPVGYFLRANLIFQDYKSHTEAKNETMKWLQPHKEHIQTDKWMGLPELTNQNGSPCYDSCTT